VDYTGFSTINVQRFGQKFVGKVANPQELLLFSKAAARAAKPDTGQPYAVREWSSHCSVYSTANSRSVRSESRAAHDRTHCFNAKFFDLRALNVMCCCLIGPRDTKFSRGTPVRPHTLCTTSRPGLLLFGEDMVQVIGVRMH